VRDRSSNAILPALPGAAAEAAAIAAGYHEASTLEPPLDKVRVMSAFGNADVVHFAGHALVNEEYPLQSRLILGGNDDQTSLMASDLSLARFARTQLVVLAACRTADGSVRRGEGVVSLARTFLGAGVRNVVATLWDVEDESARTLMQIFHERFRAEGDVTQALRSAQLHLLRSNNPALNTAKSWGAFCAIGGSADGRPSSADGR
jgi:CHAT domain-containing protein